MNPAVFPEEHFSMDRVWHTMERYGMLAPGDRVLAGVSGGCDSSALLHVLCFLSTAHGFALEAAHIDHGLRGEESDRDRLFVVSMCREYGVPLHILRADAAAEARRRSLSVEEAGRELRYGFFEECAAAMGPGTKIATAHTLSDSVETALLNMARGTALDGLCGIPAVRGRVIRPLIGTTREELEQFCAENGVAYVNDSSNYSDQYARNRLRYAAVPALRETNPAFYRAFARMTEALRADRAYLDAAAEELLRRAACPAPAESGPDAGGRSAWRAELLAGAPPALQNRAAARILQECGFACDYERIRRLRALWGGEFQLELSRGRYLRGAGGLVFSSEKQEPFLWGEVPLRVGEISLFPGKTAVCRLLTREQFENSEKFHESPLKNALDYAMIRRNPVFRARKEGDSLARRAGGRPLKKLFNEAKIPVWRRGLLAVLADEDGPLWVEGFGADRRARVSDGTERVLCVEIREETLPEDALPPGPENDPHAKSKQE